MAIKLTNIEARNNGGDGVQIAGDVDVEINGLITERNGGNGLGILPAASADALGLPADTTAAELLELLRHLRTVGADQRVEVASKSSLVARATKIGSNALDVAAKLATLAGAPQFVSLVRKLLNGCQ